MSEKEKKNVQEVSIPLNIRAQYIRDLSFENPDPIAAFTGQEQPDISVDIQANANSLGDNNFEVILDLRIEAKRKDKTVFLTELSYGSIVTIGNVPQEAVGPLVMIETPHQLFPFARAIIADVTRDAGFPPLFLAPVNFAALYQQQAQNQNDNENNNSKGKKDKKGQGEENLITN